MCSFTLYSWFLVKIDLSINLAYAYVGTLGATSHPKRQRDTRSLSYLFRSLVHFCKCPAVCPRSILHTSDNICKSTPILQMQGPCLFRTFSYTRHICVIDTNYLNSLPTRVLIYFYGTSISDVVPVKVKDIFIHKTCIIAGGIRGICVIDTNY